MSTRGELIAKLVTWSKTGDAAAKFPLDDCFDFAFDLISREVLPAELDTEWVPSETGIQPALIRSQVYKLALPADYISPVAVWNNDCALDSAVVKDLFERSRQLGAGSGPLYYSIVGSELWYGPGVGGEIRLVYTRRDAEAASAGETNHGLTYFPDVYFTASMAYLARYREDQENEPAEWSRYRDLKETINSLAEEKRRGAGVTGMI